MKKIKPDGSRTIYVGGVYEVDKSSGGSVTRTVTYYPAGGAMRINSTLYYVLKDHPSTTLRTSLGSASVVTDASGAILGEQRYYPYGETRWTYGTIYTDKLFTGQREMSGLGIYHYGARFYSPKLGRFLSADTIVPGMSNPQALNRYSYVLGNPLRYTDPTGHMQWEDTYEENDSVCDPGDVSCNWLGGGNPGVGADPDDILNGDDYDSSNDEYTPNPALSGIIDESLHGYRVSGIILIWQFNPFEIRRPKTCFMDGKLHGCAAFPPIS